METAMNQTLTILGLESSCDDTAAAVVRHTAGNRPEILASVVHGQSELHRDFGGVVPEIASRAHVERIIPVIDQAIQKAGIRKTELRAVAVAIRPGLIGSLLIGLSAGKAIAGTLRIPLIGYDHLAAHLYASRIAFGEELTYPAIGLVASGGHTSLFHLKNPIGERRPARHSLPYNLFTFWQVLGQSIHGLVFVLSHSQGSFLSGVA